MFRYLIVLLTLIKHCCTPCKVSPPTGQAKSFLFAATKLPVPLLATRDGDATRFWLSKKSLRDADTILTSFHQHTKG